MEEEFDASRLICRKPNKRIYAHSDGRRAISAIWLPGAEAEDALLNKRRRMIEDLGDCPWLNLPRNPRVIMRGGERVLIEEMLLSSEDGPQNCWEAELLRGMRELHLSGWVHMDLKPEHLLWAGGHWRIHDFDSAARDGEHLLRRDITYAYAPPDVRWHEWADAGDDRYAAALMLYRRRNGMKLPFERGSERLATIARFALPGVPIPRGWSDEARTFFQRALARARRARFPSTDAFIDAWRQLEPK